MSNPHKGVLKFRGLHTNTRYNRFFNPNMCYICKSVNRGNLILCDWCHLIPYCSEKHKAKHHPKHTTVCLSIASALQHISGTRKFDNWQQWIQSRKKLIRLVRQKYMPNLSQHVMDVILWSKSCYVCHKETDLKVCQRCFSVNYCGEHANAFHTTHDKHKCDQLKLSLNIDIRTASDNVNMSYEFLQIVNGTSRVEDMFQFYVEFVLSQRTNINWLTEDYVQSDQFSDPLTVYFGLKRAGRLELIRQSNVVIHIVSVVSVDIQHGIWEILLHLLPEIQKLLIIIVGLELRDDSYTPRLCERCRDRKKILHLVSCSRLYRSYKISGRNYQIPTIIVGFHVDSNEDHTVTCSTLWQVINILRFLSCPLVLSFSNAKKIQQFLSKTVDIFNIYVDPDLNVKNSFNGLAPHKDVETGDIYFFNDYLIVYLDRLQLLAEQCAKIK